MNEQPMIVQAGPPEKKQTTWDIGPNLTFILFLVCIGAFVAVMVLK